MKLFFYCSDLRKERKVKLVIVESFSSESEDVKSAAAYALGKTITHFLLTLYQYCISIRCSLLVVHVCFLSLDFVL